MKIDFFPALLPPALTRFNNETGLSGGGSLDFSSMLSALSQPVKTPGVISSDMPLMSVLPAVLPTPAAIIADAQKAEAGAAGRLPEAGGDLKNIIKAASDKYGVEPELIESIINHESGFQSDSVSSKGAAGLMQLMPATAKSLGVTNPFDPSQNIFAGTKYISQLLDQYHGNKLLALAAYNAGPGNVDKYGGVPPFDETKNYISRVINTYHSKLT